jgi:hypothetical protein
MKLKATYNASQHVPPLLYFICTDTLQLLENLLLDSYTEASNYTITF